MDSSRARELLTAERERIERELAGLKPEGGDGELSNVDQHPGDQGSDMYENELDQSLIERLRDDLAAVERAEKRLEEGTYGVSIESGEPIPDERLEAMPTAERTAEEQARVG